jgi:hypothetical protein
MRPARRRFPAPRGQDHTAHTARRGCPFVRGRREALFSRGQIRRAAEDLQLAGPAGEPGSGDPVRVGVSDILSFSTSGTCTAGTLFLRSSQATQYAVHTSNVTTRTRLLRYEAGRWVPA